MQGLAGGLKDLGEWAKGVMEEVCAEALALLASHGFAKAMQEHIPPRPYCRPRFSGDNVFFFRDPSRVQGRTYEPA
jgi:hypothetical protein